MLHEVNPHKVLAPGGELEFELQYEPLDATDRDLFVVSGIPGGYLVGYVAQDESEYSPDDIGLAGKNFFLVSYHEMFRVKPPKEFDITKEHVAALLSGKEESEDYWVFPLSAYIHGGVYLALGSISEFPWDPGGWNTSVVGAIFVRKEEFRTEKRAIEMADWLIEAWNAYLSGMVFRVVTEMFDKNGNPEGLVDDAGGILASGANWKKDLKEALTWTMNATLMMVS